MLMLMHYALQMILKYIFYAVYLTVKAFEMIHNYEQILRKFIYIWTIYTEQYVKTQW
jgi:hypothetical protein